MDIINIITRNHQLKDFFVNMVTWALSDTRTNSVEGLLYFQNWETLTYHGFVVIITYWIQASLQLKQVKSLDLYLTSLGYLLLNLWVPHSSLFLLIGESSLVWFGLFVSLKANSVSESSKFLISFIFFVVGTFVAIEKVGKQFSCVVNLYFGGLGQNYNFNWVRLMRLKQTQIL